MKKAPVYTSKCVLLYQNDNLHTLSQNLLNEKNTINLKKTIQELPINLFPKIAHSQPFLVELIDSKISNDSILNLSTTQTSLISSLKNKYSISINEKEKLITIEATMHSPKEAAELVQKIQQIIYKYTTRWYNQQKAEYIQTLENNYEYIISQSLAIQQKLNAIKGSNHKQNDQETQNLAIEYKSLEKLNITIAEQLQITRLEQKNAKKYFTIIDPPTISNTPSYTSKSVTYYIIAFAFLGLIISIYIILIHPIIKNLLAYQEIDTKE